MTDAMRQSAAHGEPTQIGPYRILRKLGEGGMGAVYLAMQEHPLKREVALKIIKLGMDTREVVARFEAERQALARMDHPNIASVFDAGGTPDGRPYFVMERVLGVPITEYCDGRRLTTRERLGLFSGVCAATQHAHQKGIIHRDIKPSNVLVVEHDGRPVPKVIDFGIAKATGEEAGRDEQRTVLGFIIGTLEYMSPEQAGVTGQDVDSRTDIYSLGVLLYELLSGALPFDSKRLRSTGIAEVQRIIRDEEPPRPSTRFTSLGEGAADVSGRRATNVPGLERQLQGDLDWITLKAIEKDRTRRYQSASEFAADIERYLADEPVAARPPSLSYRAGKFIRRNRLAVSAAALVFAAVVTGLIISSVLYLREGRARGEAVAQGQRADEATLTAVAKANSELVQRRIAEDATRAEARARKEALQSLSTAETNLYFNNIGLADRELGVGNIAHVDELLGQVAPRLRNWEWHNLLRLAHMEAAVLRFDASAVDAITIHGDRFIAATDDQQLVIGSVAKRRVERRLQLPATTRTRVPVTYRFSPDSSLFVMRTNIPGKVIADVRRSDTGDVVAHLVPLPGEILASLVFSPDNTRVFGVVTPSGRTACDIRVWPIAPAGPSQLLATDLPPCVSVIVSADGARIVSAGFHTTTVVHAVTGQVLTNVTRADRGRGTSTVQVSPDGRLIAGGLFDPGIALWHDAEENAAWSVMDPTVYSSARAASALQFSDTGGRVAAAFPDSSIRVFDTVSGAETDRFTSTTVARGLAFSSDMTSLWSSDAAGVIRVWNLSGDTPATPLSIDGGVREPAAISVSRDRRLVVSAAPTGAIQAWNLDTRQPVMTIPALPAPPSALSNAGPPIAFGMLSAFAMTATGEKVLMPATAVIKTVDGVENGSPIALVFDVRTGKRVAVVGSGEKAESAMVYAGPLVLTKADYSVSTAATALSVDGKWAAMLTSAVRTEDRVLGVPRSEMTVWNTQTGQRTLRVALEEGYMGAPTFSPDGRCFVFGMRRFDATETIWSVRDAATGRPRMSFQTDAVGPVSFSGDGRLLVAVSRTNEVTARDLSTGATVFATAPQPGFVISDVAFSPDGERFVAVSREGAAEIFDARTGRFIMALRKSMTSPSIATVLLPTVGNSSTPQPQVAFSDDGRRIVVTRLVRVPNGVRIQIETWNGSPRR